APPRASAPRRRALDRPPAVRRRGALRRGRGAGGMRGGVAGSRPAAPGGGGRRRVSFRTPATPRSGRARRVTLTAFVAIGLALTAVAAWPRAAGAQGETTLKVDPPTQNVSPGQEFVVNIIQSAAVTTTGAQVNVTFDPKLVQMKDFALGDAYTSKSAIFAFGNADLGSNGNKDLTLSRANKFGTLENAAGFLLPGSGTVPAGDTV